MKTLHFYRKERDGETSFSKDYNSAKLFAEYISLYGRLGFTITLNGEVLTQELCEKELESLKPKLVSNSTTCITMSCDDSEDTLVLLWMIRKVLCPINIDDRDYVSIDIRTGRQVTDIGQIATNSMDFLQKLLRELARAIGKETDSSYYDGVCNKPLTKVIVTGEVYFGMLAHILFSDSDLGVSRYFVTDGFSGTCNLNQKGKDYIWKNFPILHRSNMQA